MTQGLLRIYVEDKDGNVVGFPLNEEQAVVKDWTRTAERMAGAPSVTGTVMHRLCLDNLWTKKEFVVIGGERYYVKQVPTSSKDTEDVRYKHDVTLVSERDILENVYFFDVVTKREDAQASDKPRSNTTDFSFYGDLNELVQRLNDSLSYSKIYDAEGVNGFCIVIDEDVEIGEAKEVSITDAYFATAMQEIYNVFKVPYYWVGKVCHVGYAQNEISTPFEYGKDNGLLSVSKNNSEYRLINRITGMGSADNIPYYYPNTDPNGEPILTIKNMDRANIKSIQLTTINAKFGGSVGKTFCLGNIKEENATTELFNDDKTLNGIAKYAAPYEGEDEEGNYYTEDPVDSQEEQLPMILEFEFYAYVNDFIDMTELSINTSYETSGATISVDFNKAKQYQWGTSMLTPIEGWDALVKIVLPDGKEEIITANDTTYHTPLEGVHKLIINCTPSYRVSMHPASKPGALSWATVYWYCHINGSIKFKTFYGDVIYQNGSVFKIDESGISIIGDDLPKLDLVLQPSQDYGSFDAHIIGGSIATCAQFTITGIDFINPISKLMPYVYREKKGTERFYNAVNDKYQKENGEYYSFNNPYLPNEPLEGKQDFEDIKPTINGITNAQGQLFGEVADIAFDETDSDDLAIKDGDSNTANLVHTYFYIKLHKFDGDYGFNLFKQGLSKGAMTLNFISGSCAGCAFEVGVSKPSQVDNHYEFENPIQVDESGNIVAGDYDDKVKEGNPIKSQQDTTTNEVWIALKKDQSTFGVVMPNATNNYKPKAGDKFVITNILLPQVYITAAEKRLEAALIKYMSENNDEKFTFSIKFSRIYLQKHIEDIVPYLNENARINVKYNNTTYPLYVSSYTQKYDGNILDEISVELSEELTIAQNKSKQQMDSILGNVNEQINSALKDNNNNSQQGVTDSDLVAIKNLLNNKLSKVSADTAAGLITFLQGTNWGNFTSETGAAMTVDPTTGQTYMEVDRLKVRLKAFFEQLEVQKVGYVGGKIVVSKGQGVDILDVEEVFDSEGNLSAYRCYFLGEQEGRRIDNLLRVDDQMICKDENISEGSTDGASNKYYWRLATAVSSDVVKRGNNVCHWVDLSATDCDTNSDIPSVGDTICQLGNRTDIDRQGAEILSVVDANSPSFTIYSGINNYSLVNKEYIDMGVSGGKAFCNIYGSTYIGDRNRENGYISWDYDKEENVWKMRVKGTIDITSQLSSGGTIGGAIDNAANAYKGEFDAFTSNVNEVIGGFQAQIDGVIETWFYDPEPKLDNLPASEWKDNTTKDKHLGDLYYSKDGLAYRFQKEGDIYKWVRIDDTAITSALKEAKKANDAANKAQGTADSKMKVFVKQPTNNDEYSIGDMWVNATYPADGSTYNNEILHCVTAKAAGEAFSISHWAQSSNIKTQFNNFVNNTYAEDKKDFYNQLDGKVETWYQSADPKDKWNKADYSKHKGDIWYNDSTNKSYRWTGTAWVELKDQAAIDAKTLAESKRRVFTTTTLPTPPYDARDLWVQGENGDIMVCVTPKAAGTTASASDWTKASKYTDDTAAKAAQATANAAAAAAKNIDDAILAIDNNVDVALKDKIITKTEAAAIGEALNSLSAIMADVTKTYAELMNNDVYKLVASDVRTSYKNAYDKLVATFNALSDYITNTLTKANPITSEILSTYNTHYTNFKTDYEAYVSKLNVVRNSMDALLNTRIGDISTMLGGLKATTDAMDESTQINGGLILSTLLALGYTEGNNFNVMSGVSGLSESDTEKGGGIAFWAGGHRIDINDCTKNADGTYSMGGKVVNPADFLVRHDGTGYAAGGKMWWDADGKIHADPQSFLINEEYVGNVMQLFKFEYSGGTEFINIVHAIPQKPFESLSVGANGLTLYNGDKSAKFYIKDGVLFLEGDLAVTGGITMYASDGVKSGMIDQVYAVLDQSLFSIVNGVITITGEIGSGTVKGISIKGTQYDPDPNGIIALTLNWGDLTGVPTTFTPSAHTHDDRYYTESEIDTKLAGKADKATTLAGYGITDAYTKTEVNTKLTDGSVTKVGTANVGATNVPIYLKAGVPTAVTLIDTANNLINNLTTGTSTPVDADYYIAQYVGGGTTTTTFHRRPHSALYAYIKGKAEGTWAISVSGNAATATTASKLGTATVGSGTQHFYLNAGTATASTSTVGGTAKPMYLKAGVMTAISDTVGGTAKPVFLNAGTLTAISATVGSASKPVYLSGGSITACSYDFTSYLPLAGGTMAAGARISHADGNMYIGRSDNNGWLMCQDMCSQSGSTYWKLMANGTFHSTVAVVSGNTSVGSLTINGINVTKSSDGILKIDGNLIVTGGITMYATDGVASGLMEQILVDGTTIGKKADGTLYAINTGNVRSIIMGSTTYTPNDSGAVTLPEKVTWANIEGKPSTFTPSAHTHAISDITDIGNASVNYATSAGNANYANSAGNADTLDGCHAYSFLIDRGGNYTGLIYDLPCKSIFSGFNLTDAPTTGWVSGLILGSNWNSGHYQHYLVESGSRWYTTRDASDGRMTNWNTFAYLTDNVASATKLQTARTIWGQSFDGTGDIAISNAAKMPYVLFKNYNNDNNAGYCGRGSSVSNQIYLTAYSGNAVGIGANNTDNVLYINTSLNVGIGTTSPSYKFHVAGDIYTTTGFKKNGSSDSYVLLGGGGHKAVSDFATSGHTHSYLPLSGGTMTGNINIGNSDIIGYGGARILQNLSGNLGINPSNNVGIGTTSPSYKLHVNGTLGVEGAVTATSFVGNASSATKLTSSAGSATLPIYFSDGKPVACTMSTGNGAGVLRSFARGIYTSANQYFGNGTIVTIDPKGTGCISANDTILSLGDLSIRNTQLLVAYDRDGVYYRRITDGLSYGDWKRLAFTTDNVASATSAGNSDTCDGLHVHGGRNNEANKIVRTDGNGYIQCGYINSSSGNEGNNSSPARVWGTNGSDSYMRTYLTSALNVYTSGSVRSESGNKTTGLQYYSASGGFTKDGTGVGGAWSVPSDSVDAQYGNGQAIRMWWGATYYTDILSGPNAWGATKGLYIRQIVNGAISAGTFTGGWRLLLDSSNYNRYVPTLTGGGASGTWGISISGNAATASKWATARKITLTGSVTGEVSIDGSGDVSLTTTTNHTHSYVPLSGGTMTGNLILKGGTSADMTYAGNVHPSIRFDNSDSSQNVSLIFTDYDSYRAPAGLKLVGNQGNEWFEAADIYATTFHGALSGNAATATTASKLGTANVGSGTQHFYLNAGTATASTSTVGGTAKPIYLNGGTLTAISTTAGSTTLPVYLNAGTITACTASSVFSNLSNSGNSLSVTVAGQNRTLTVNYASNAGDADTLDGYHLSSIVRVVALSNAAMDANSLTTSNVIYYPNHDLNTNRNSWNNFPTTKPDGGFNLLNLSSGGGGYKSQIYIRYNDNHIYTRTQKFSTSGNAWNTWSQCALMGGTANTGDFLVSGGITMYSDLRKKNILSDEVLSVKEIAAAPLFKHTYKSDENQYIHVGTSAQYWSGIHEDWFTRKDSEGYYQMELQNLGVAMGISLAREIVKYESKTDKKIRIMKKKINDLEEANKALDARIKELEERRTA